MFDKLDLRKYLDSKFPGKVEPHGLELGIPCPDCDQDRESDFRLWMNTDKLIGVCYKCNETYNVLSLVQRLEDCGKLEAINILKGYSVGGAVSSDTFRKRVQDAVERKEAEETEDEHPEIELPEGFVGCWETKRWPKYIEQRMPRKDALEYKVGWCQVGYYRSRMIVPVYSRKKLVTYIARDMTGKADKKILYPKGTHTNLLLSNYDVAKTQDEVVLTEAVLDAMRVGVKGMATFGSKRLAPKQLGLLLSCQARKVTILFDGDGPGREGAYAVEEQLRPYYRRLRVGLLPEGKDPDDFDRETLWGMINAVPFGGAFETRVRAQLGL